MRCDVYLMYCTCGHFYIKLLINWYPGSQVWGHPDTTFTKRWVFILRYWTYANISVWKVSLGLNWSLDLPHWPWGKGHHCLRQFAPQYQILWQHQICPSSQYYWWVRSPFHQIGSWQYDSGKMPTCTWGQREKCYLILKAFWKSRDDNISDNNQIIQTHLLHFNTRKSLKWEGWISKNFTKCQLVVDLIDSIIS